MSAPAKAGTLYSKCRPPFVGRLYILSRMNTGKTESESPDVVSYNMKAWNKWLPRLFRNIIGDARKSESGVALRLPRFPPQSKILHPLDI